MKIKEFFRKWGEGIKTLPATSQLKSKRIGHIGAIVGFILGFGIMGIKGAWYFLVLGFFLIWLQVNEVINTTQQIESAKNMEQKLKGMEVVNETKDIFTEKNKG